jgi:hypothetical protein
MSDQWETFCDVGYYHMWRLRSKTERGWNDGFHINTKAEAEGLCELLNKLEGEIERERALANEAIATWKKTREERNEAREQRDMLAEEIENLKASGIHTCHDQCKRPMCAMRRQRDRLAESLRMICVADWKTAGELRNMARQAIMEGGSDERR